MLRVFFFFHFLQGGWLCFGIYLSQQKIIKYRSDKSFSDEVKIFNDIKRNKWKFQMLEYAA